MCHGRLGRAALSPTAGAACEQALESEAAQARRLAAPQRVADLIEDARSRLYDLPPDDVPILHHHKGYDPESPPELNEHVFREVTVRRLSTGEAVSAWTYIAVPDNTTAPPSAAYVNAIIDGARYHGLPRAYMLVLQGIRTA